MLFAALYVLNTIFMALWDNAMSFDICWGGVWKLYFYGVYIWTYEAIAPFVIGCVQYYNVTGGIQYYEMFIDLMMLYFFVYVVQAVIAHIPKLTESITGAAGSATSVAKMATNIVAKAGKAVMGDPEKKQARRDMLAARRDKEDKYREKKDKKSDKDKPTESSDATASKAKTPPGTS